VKALRMVGAGVAGVVAAGLVVAVIEGVSHAIYAPAAPQDLSTPEAMAAFVATLPLGAFLFVLAAYVAGTFAGGLVAAAIARRRAMLFAGIVGGLILLGAAVNFVLIPHPAWFIAATIVGVPLVALATGRLGGTWLEA
jgi:hypothetical protein